MEERGEKQKQQQHHHRHSKIRHFRRWLRHHKKQAAATLLLCLCVAAGLGFYAYREQKKQASRTVTAKNSYDAGSGYRIITYKGKQYQYNSLVTAVLYAGLDEEGMLAESAQYGNKARADMINLVVLDKLNEKITVLSINRDTMTEIRRYSMNGNDNGLYTSHIGYAYTYGNGGKVSCENLCEAVSNLLGGIPILEYVVSGQASMPWLNDLVGGVTLTVPNDDLSELYPEMSKGSTVTLDETNVLDYVHYRDAEEAFSNEGRMERQQAYVTAYIQKAQQMGKGEIETAWESLESMDGYLQTSITKNKYLDMASLVRKLDFSEGDFIQLEGEDREGELHDEFWPDEEALQELVIELFYEEV